MRAPIIVAGGALSLVCILSLLNGCGKKENLPDVGQGGIEPVAKEAMWCSCITEEDLALVDEEDEALLPLQQRERREPRLAPVPQPGLATADGMPIRVFFGNLHSHTSYSDGLSKPEAAFEHARDVAGLDFLALTEHNHRSAGSANGRRIAFHNDRYKGPRSDALIPVAERLTQSGSFVALYGQEFSSISEGNHMNVFDVPEVISDSDVSNGFFRRLIDTWLPGNLDSSGEPALLQLNHPWSSSSPNSLEYGRDDYSPFATWVAKVDAHAQLIEVINGPSHKDGSGREPAVINGREYRRYLKTGFHLAPTANQDNHFETWGSITDARTGVLATTLDKASILGALKQRRAYASLDKNLRVVMTVQNELLGSIINSVPASGEELAIGMSLIDDDEPEATYWVEVFADNVEGDSADSGTSLVATYGPIEVTEDTTEWDLPGLTYDGWDYLYFRILQGDEAQPEKQAWMAPVWFEPTN